MFFTVLFFLVSFFATVIGSISGIGGGIIIKPVLEFASDYDVMIISFLSSCTVLSMAVISLIRQRKNAENFEFRRGTLLAIGSTFGGVLGKLLFDCLKSIFGTDTLGLIQSLFLCITTLGLLAYYINKRRINAMNIVNSPICMLLGFALGMLSAFLGIGGGPINLAALSFFLSMDNKKAALHSIYIILFSQCASLILTFVRASIPIFPIQLLISSILGGLCGGLLGSKISKSIDNDGIGNIYGALLLFIIVISTVNAISYYQKLL